MGVIDVLELVTRLGADASDDAQARAVGLVLSDDGEPGITRIRRGRGFSFHEPDGSLLRGAARDRCLALAVPPAWTDVWICVEPDGHLQAVGRDDAARKQYLYHDAWRELREAAKFAALPRFGVALPSIRSRIDSDLRRRRLDHDRVMALVLALLDRTLLRIGSEQHADDDTGGHGLTTITDDHVELGRTVARFRFLGKSAVEQDLTLRDRRLVRHLRRLDDAVTDAAHAGEVDLLAWTADGERWHDVRAVDVNAHLRAIAGREVSAKDFRTWGGTVRAMASLRTAPPPADDAEADRQRIAAVDAAAEALGNTRAVARASYVHPLVLDARATGAVDEVYDDEPGMIDHLDPDERAVLRLLGAETVL